MGYWKDQQIEEWDEEDGLLEDPSGGGDTVHSRLIEALSAKDVDPDLVTMESPTEWSVSGDVEIIIEVSFDGKMNDLWAATRRDGDREDVFAGGDLDTVAAAVSEAIQQS